MAKPAPEPIWDVVEEHLDEAAFLWTHREAALSSPVHSLAEVAVGPEERLVAHLAGVGVAGPDADDPLILPALAAKDPGRVAAAAAVLAMGRRLEPLRRAAAGPAVARWAIARALALCLPRDADAALAPWLAGEPGPAAVALDALAARGAAPLAPVRAWLDARHPEVLGSALAAAPLLGDAARPAVEGALGHADPAVRDAAVEAGLRLGLRSAVEACRRAADAGAATPLALEVLAGSGEAEDVARIAAAARRPEQRHAALFAAGLSGTAAGADVCAGWLEHDDFARTAAEGIWAVTGLAIEGAYAAPEPEPDLEPPPLHGGAPAAPALPPEDARLPWPDGALVALHWRDRRKTFPAGRHLLGRPWTAAGAHAALCTGPTRRRAALARELAVRTRGAWRIDVRAWARAQLRVQAERPFPAQADAGAPLSRLLRG